MIEALDQFRFDDADIDYLATLKGNDGEPLFEDRFLDSLRTLRFTGQLDRARLSRELMNQDLCVQPSFTEGFSKAWLDAMAHGLPVLASQVGAAKGVLGHVAHDEDGVVGVVHLVAQVMENAARLTHTRCRHDDVGGLVPVERNGFLNRADKVYLLELKWIFAMF